MVLIAAVAIGLIAAWMLRAYIKDKELEANPNPVDVYMVTADVKRGEPFTTAKAVIKRQTIPVKFRPDTAVVDLKALEGKVAVTNLAANQVLVEGMFVSSELAATGLRDRLGEGMVAIAVPIEGVKAVGGLLQPGDEVNIMVTSSQEAATDSSSTQTTTAPTAASTKLDPKTAPYSGAARYLYQQVRILSIGTSVRPQPGEAVTATSATANTVAQSGGSIVFEVPADAAQVLASIDPASFYLTLIPRSWNLAALPPFDAKALDGATLLPGEDPTKVTPYGPKGYAPAAVSETGSGGTTPTTTKAN